jgi:hypothetical protein
MSCSSVVSRRLYFQWQLCPRIQRRAILPRQNLPRLEALALPGSCLKVNGICEPFHSGPGASQQLQAALAHATAAGKVYILVGLRRCDPAAYQKIFGSLARPIDDVEVARGCIISREPFRQLLSQTRRSIR